MRVPINSSVSGKGQISNRQLFTMNCVSPVKARAGILAIEFAQAPVDRGVFSFKYTGSIKEILARHCKELTGVSGCVFIHERRVACVDTAVQVLEGGVEVAAPGVGVHIPVQWRTTVCLTIQHVKLVSHLMDNDVITLAPS